MSRQKDLESHVRESYAIIREYEDTIRTSGRPEEKQRARRLIDEQWALIEGYLAEYRRLAGVEWPQDLAEIAAHFRPGSAPPERAAPANGPSTILFNQDRQVVGQQINVAGDYNASGAPPGQHPAQGSTASGPDAAPGATNGSVVAGWSSERIRQLLLAAFSDQELMTLCFDHFRAVYDDLSGGLGKGEKVQRLLEHCLRYGQVDRLLEVVRAQNPVQYERFESHR